MGKPRRLGVTATADGPDVASLVLAHRLFRLVSHPSALGECGRSIRSRTRGSRARGAKLQGAQGRAAGASGARRRKKDVA